MQIEYLYEFVALAEHLNFCEAAKHLYITQPVLSRHIAALEQYVGVKLFHRDPHKVSLTPEGEIFLSQIRVIIKQFDALRSEMALRSLGVKSSLCIGISNHAINDYLGSVPALFSERNPNIRLSYYVDEPEKCVSALLARTLDVCFGRRKPFQHEEDLQFYDLYLEPVVLLLRKDHVFAGRESISIPELRGQRFLLIGGSYHQNFWNTISGLCREHGFEPEDTVVLSNMEVALLEARQGGGIIVSAWHRRHLTGQELACVPLEGCCDAVSLIWRKDHGNSAVPLLLEACRQAPPPAGMKRAGADEAGTGCRD